MKLSNVKDRAKFERGIKIGIDVGSVLMLSSAGGMLFFQHAQNSFASGDVGQGVLTSALGIGCCTVASNRLLGIFTKLKPMKESVEHEDSLENDKG